MRRMWLQNNEAASSHVMIKAKKESSLKKEQMPVQFTVASEYELSDNLSMLDTAELEQEGGGLTHSRSHSSTEQSLFM